MTASKRKNENVDYVTHELTKMVIVNDSNHQENENENEQGPPNQGVHPTARTPMERMKLLRERWGAAGGPFAVGASEGGRDDEIALAIGSFLEGGAAEEERESEMLGRAEEVRAGLAHQIQRARELYREESSDLSDLSRELGGLKEEKKALLREIDELESRQRASQENIAVYQAEAAQELDEIMDVEEQRKQHVPRLKMTISLFASTTGIKWDFCEGKTKAPSNVPRCTPNPAPWL